MSSSSRATHHFTTNPSTYKNIPCQAMEYSNNSLSSDPTHSTNSCEILFPSLITSQRSRRKRKRLPAKCLENSNLSEVTSLLEPANVNSDCSSSSSNLEQHVTSIHSRLTAGVSLALSKHTSFTTAAALAALLVFCSACSLCAASPCDGQSWWNPNENKCITCTVCEGDLIPLRPCQLHRDTICGSIYDLKIDWLVLAKTEPNWKEVNIFKLKCLYNFL